MAQQSRIVPTPSQRPLAPLVWAFILAGVTLLLVLPPPALLAANGLDEAEAGYQQNAAAFQSLKKQPATGKQPWQELAGAFFGFYQAHPTHNRAADALYSSALAYRQAYQAESSWADLNRAVEVFQQFQREFPAHPLADDSLIHIGFIFQHEYKDHHVAYLEYAKVVQDYPQGDQVRLAQKRLAELAPYLEEGAPPAGTAAGGAPSTAPDRQKAAQLKPAAKPLQAAQTQPLPPKPAGAVAEPANGLTGGVVAIRTGFRPAGAATPQPNKPARLIQAQQLATASHSRVILTLTRPVAYQFAMLEPKKGKPGRLYLDLEGVRPAKRLSLPQGSPQGHITRLRMGTTAQGATRLVLDLQQPAPYKVSHVVMDHEVKIMVDLFSPGEEGGENASGAAPVRRQMEQGRFMASQKANPAPKATARQNNKPRALATQPKPAEPDQTAQEAPAQEAPAKGTPAKPVLAISMARALKKEPPSAEAVAKPAQDTPEKAQTGKAAQKEKTTKAGQKTESPEPQVAATEPKAALVEEKQGHKKAPKGKHQQAKHQQAKHQQAQHQAASQPASGKLAQAEASAVSPAAYVAPSQLEPTPAPGAPLGKGGEISLKRALGLKVKTVVIDPGHGGQDPGAVAFGLKEKVVALRIAQELKKIFQKQAPHLNVVLTREDDTFIPLDKRPMLAKQMGGDLFVSIHLNANSAESVQGVESYFLNLTTDPTAIQVAARENAATEKQVGDMTSILSKLMRNTKIQESQRLANQLQAGLVNRLSQRSATRNLGVKQAPFMVLLGSEMPSVLVEAGFITNRAENKQMRSKRYLRTVAQGIYNGLSGYIEEQNTPQPQAY